MDQIESMKPYNVQEILSEYIVWGFSKVKVQGAGQVNMKAKYMMKY